MKPLGDFGNDLMILLIMNFCNYLKSIYT